MQFARHLTGSEPSKFPIFIIEAQLPILRTSINCKNLLCIEKDLQITEKEELA